MKATGDNELIGQGEQTLMDFPRFRRPLPSETDHIAISSSSLGEKKSTSTTSKYLLLAVVGILSMLYVIFASRDQSNESQVPDPTQLHSKSATVTGAYRKDSTLGGLLANPGEFEPGSCHSRGHQYHIHSQYKPSLILAKRLRAYEALHRKCTGARFPKFENGEITPESDEDRECQYIVWIAYSGLGNRLMTIASAFTYALLTGRVLLIDKSADVNDLFCEPFPGISWFLPATFPSAWLEGADENSPVRFGHVIKETEDNFPRIRYVHLTHTSDHIDKRFFCGLEQEKLLSIPWLLLKSNNYFVPALYFIPSFRIELDKLFPQREAIFHLVGRYLFHPSNDVWGLITRFHRAYLSEAEERVGLQIRTFSDDHLLFFSDQLRHCAFQHGLLPNAKQNNGTELQSMEHDQGKKPTAVLVTSLQQQYYEDLREYYLANPTESGRYVAVHQQSHEAYQKTDEVGHDKRAWADIYLLSFSDILVTSPWSTFGYAAQGLAGIKSYILLKVFNNSAPLIPHPPCVLVSSPEPCFHAPPVRTCDSDTSMDPATLLPFVQVCEDVPWGIKVVGS